jgi:hypothetical protein
MTTSEPFVVRVMPADVKFILTDAGWTMGLFDSFPMRLMAWHRQSGQIKALVIPESFAPPEDMNHPLDRQEHLQVQLDFLLLKELTGIRQEFIGVTYEGEPS